MSEFWSYRHAKWEAPVKWVQRRALLDIMDDRRWLADEKENTAWLNEKVRVCYVIAWKSTAVHLRSNKLDHLGACGEPGGSGRSVGWVPLDRVTCLECQSILAAYLLAEEDSVVVL